MNVAIYPADLFGCGHYRLIHPARVLIAAGHKVTIHPPQRQGLVGARDPVTGEPVVKGIPPETDVVVLQRVTHAHLSASIPQFRRQGVAVVIDMDDDLASIHPSNPAHLGLHPRNNGGFSWRAAQDACTAATLVTVSTSALASRYVSRTGGAVVLDNYVPASYLDVPHADRHMDIGYAGSLHSHPDDVPQVGFAVERLVSEGVRFRVVGGAAEGFASALGLSAEPDTSGPLDITDWPRGMSSLGVGIAPLADTRFNEAKSRLKVLEMSALGVPWVASPRAEYARFHRETGLGFLARRPRDWFRHLGALARDTEFRTEHGSAGRTVVADLALTYEANAWRWLEAWDLAHSLERGAKRTSYPGVS